MRENKNLLPRWKTSLYTRRHLPLPISSQNGVNINRNVRKRKHKISDNLLTVRDLQNERERVYRHKLHQFSVHDKYLLVYFLWSHEGNKMFSLNNKKKGKKKRSVRIYRSFKLSVCVPIARFYIDGGKRMPTYRQNYLKSPFFSTLS